MLNVWRSTWLVTWSSRPAALVIASMTSAIASVVILVPLRRLNSAAESAPGLEGRSASQAATPAYRTAWRSKRGRRPGLYLQPRPM